ncbi:MAG: hypothetical protein ABSG84_11395 [Acidobacteriaceae bacterium]|jgi:hypothetical protein
MKTMQTCSGESCDCVPDEVCDAVWDSLRQIPGGDDPYQVRDARAEWLAPRMATEGWRFCHCFPLLRTEQHARIYDLVHTNRANHLAHKAARERAA